MKNVFPLLVTLFLCSNNLFAQNKVGETSVSVITGVSLIGLYYDAPLLLSTGSSNELKYTSNTTPVFGLAIDYSLIDLFSIGLAGSFQHFENRVSLNSFSAYTRHEVNRINLSVRSLFHIPNKEKVDLYGGLRLGATLWRDSESASFDANNNKLSGEKQGNYVLPSFQLLIGVKVYLIDNLALNAELAIGSPYFLAIGLAYTFSR